MILPIHQRVRQHVAAVLADLYGIESAAIPDVVVDYPPMRTLGDLALPLAFDLARRLRKAPRVIAQELAAALGAVRIEGVRRVEAAPNGYLNLYLDRSRFLIGGLTVAGPATQGEPVTAGKAIVEHTAINPNKAAHIGHLRNVALGDTLVRCLSFRRVPVEVQNYIDDTGVQVADVVVGLVQLESKSLDEIRSLAESPRFDYYCWDLYARVTEWYEADRERLKFRAAALHDIEHGGNDTAVAAAILAARIVRRHLETMRRLNVTYDLLTWEGDILRLQFWGRAFEILKEKGAVFLQDRGKLAGCWVMRIEDEGELASESENDTSEEQSADPREKVIVRSNGTVTYVGKDIAYQFWKFGLLGRDFYYRVFEEGSDGRPVWATSSTPSDEPHPPFGRAETTYNVIDVRQAYLQKLLKQALATIGYEKEADRSVHFSYEMVTLSHRTARKLGYEPAELGISGEGDAKRPWVEVSGRKGQGVKVDDLLDTVVETAAGEVTRRNPEFEPAEVERIAGMIGVAAVRYFMMKYSRTRVIAFDIEEALSFEGESGPYLQYAVVRANNIFQKLKDRDRLTENDVLQALGSTPATELDGIDRVEGETAGHELWGLVLEASRLDEIVEQVVRTLEFSVLAKWAFGVAQAFNAFYHRSPVLNEERLAAKVWRAAGVMFFRAQMTRALDLMGIQVPPRM